MRDVFHDLTEKLDAPLTLRGSICVLLAAILLPLSFTMPLWHMDFWAQQYPEGLRLFIYSHSLIGGDDGNDLQEINVLNHYIGMKELRQEDFTELKWIPLVVGLITVLTLRSVFIGTLGSVLDLIVISGYFALFSLWSFWYKLRAYGYEVKDEDGTVTAKGVNLGLNHVQKLETGESLSGVTKASDDFGAVTDVVSTQDDEGGEDDDIDF